MARNINELLGKDAKYLLNHKSKTISKNSSILQARILLTKFSPKLTEIRKF